MNEAKGLKIEAGKEYRGENGKKYHVGFELKNNTTDHVFVGENENGTICLWTKTGYSVTDTRLVAEWVEPKRIRGWVNVKRHRPTGDEAIADLGGGVWPTRELADSVANEDRIACIEIDVLEGHGLGEAA